MDTISREDTFPVEMRDMPEHLQHVKTTKFKIKHMKRKLSFLNMFISFIFDSDASIYNTRINIQE